MIRLAVRVQRDRSELVLAELLDLAPGGVEEVQLDGGTVEYAVYGAPGELPGLPDLTAAVGESLVEISTSTLADDWHERWREFHRPVLISAAADDAAAAADDAATDDDAAADADRSRPSLRIRPPWEPAAGEAQSAGDAAPPQALEIVIDPGQAFGTGAHATTRMCLQLLLGLGSPGVEPSPGEPRPLLDVGTGSGVLAIAAGLLGYGPLLGLDNEQESVLAAAENAAVNGVALETRRFDLRSEALPWPGSPLVIAANLLRPLLLELAARLPQPPAHLIAGGLLAAEADEIASAFAAAHGLRERRRLSDGEWAALWLSP